MLTLSPSSMFRLSLGLLIGAGVILSHNAIAGDIVGTLPGNLSVNNNGSANYTIPLDVPPGINGMQPSLALTYDSQAGNGIMGIGWDVSTGFPKAITRGRSFNARHGEVRGVNFDSNDKFYLDGKLLICVSGEYGKPNSVYRTEVDSFVSIAATGSGTNIESFVVTCKNGQKLYFGKYNSTTDAYQYGKHQTSSTSPMIAYTWALKRAEDANCNAVDFLYNYTLGNEYTLDTISYGSSSSSSGTSPFTIKFVYESKQNDATSDYVNDYKFVHSKRVCKIQVTSALPSSYKVYDLTYENAPNFGPSRLVSVQTKYTDDNGAIISLNPTIFEWSDYNQSFNNTPVASLTSSGSTNPIWVCGFSVDTSMYDSCSVDKYAFGDFNGDGKDDYLDMSNGHFMVSLSNGNTFDAPVDWGSSGLPCASHLFRICDINGDGRKDVVFGLTTYEDSLPKWLGTKCIYAVVSKGNGFSGLDGTSSRTVIWTLNDELRNIQPSGGPDSVDGTLLMVNKYEKSSFTCRINVADFNGDGLDDIMIHRYDGYISVQYSKVPYVVQCPYNSSQALTNTILIEAIINDCPFIVDGNVYGYNVPRNFSVSPMVCDVNGDGAMDYVWKELSQFTSVINKGQTCEQTLYGGHIWYYCMISLPEGGFSHGSMITYPSRGYTSWNGYAMHNETTDLFMQGDVNGDGKTDFLNLYPKQMSLTGPFTGGVYSTITAEEFAQLYPQYTAQSLYQGTTTIDITINNKTFTKDYILGSCLHLSYAKADVYNGFSQDLDTGISPTFNYIDADGDSNTLHTWWEDMEMSEYYNRGFSSPVFIADDDTIEEKRLSAYRTTGSMGNILLADINDDGRDDYVWACDFFADSHDTDNSIPWYVEYSLGETFSAPQPVPNADHFYWKASSQWNDSYIDKSPKQYNRSAVDINGDGYKDWAQFYAVNMDYKPSLESIQINTSPKGNLLIGITDGLGRKTEIVYKPITDSTVYTQGAVDDPSTTSVTEGVTYPIREARSPMYVVSDLYKDFGGGDFGVFGAPVYGASGNKLRDVYVISYQYAGARTDLSGRGFLGFQAFVTLDRQTNLFKYQFLAQSFPMTGLAVREQTYRALNVAKDSKGNVTSVDLRLLDSKDNVVRYDEVKNPASSTLWGTLFPYTPFSRERKWEDSTTAHYTGVRDPLALSARALPSGFYCYIDAYTWMDNQTFAATIASLPALPTAFKTNETAPSSAGFASNTSVPVGFTTWAALDALNVPGLITYGNATKTLVEYYDAANTANVFKTQTVNVYLAPSSSNANLTGLLDWTQTSVYTPDYPTWTGGPVSSFTYDSCGLAITKKTDAGSTSVTNGAVAVDNANSGLTTIESYTRNARGQVTKTEISGDGTGYYSIGGSHKISEITAWDSTGRFPATVVDTYDHATTTLYDAYGRATDVTNYNGEHNVTTYDALGRVLKTEDKLRELSVTSAYGYTGSGSDYTATQTVELPWPAPADSLTLASAYYLREVAPVSPPVTTYFDRTGRKIRTIREGYNGLKTYTDTIYNRDGEIVAQSLPYAAGGNKYWNFTTYDTQGRVSTITTPNGTVTTNTYSGLVTQCSVDATDRDAQTTTTLKNARGETVAVWNADNVPSAYTTTTASGNASLKYVLDGFGRMRITKMLQNTSGTYVNITAAYDALGKQTQLVDPDKGAWVYIYNAQGELAYQKDAKAATTTMTYDVLGRMLTRVVTETTFANTETTNWYYYDTTDDAARHLVHDPAQQWIGALQRETLTQYCGTSSIFYYWTSSQSYNYTNATSYYYDEKGRQYLELFNIDGKWFYKDHRYDDYGREVQTCYYWRPPTLESDMNTTPYVWQSYGYTTTYDAESYVLSVKDTLGKVWWKADTTAGYDYMDRPVLYQKGGPGSYWTRQDYDAWTGALYVTTTGPLSGTVVEWIVQRNVYLYDGLGNLTSREDVKRAVTETFTYDTLNRLTSTTVGSRTLTNTYAPNGNILSKTDVAGTTSNYTYSAAQIHAVTNVGTHNINYDTNGNMTLDWDTATNDETAVRWNGYDKPRWITTHTISPLTTKGSEFIYGPSHERVVHLEYDSASNISIHTSYIWMPLHYTDKKIYVSNGGLELEYKNAVTSTTSADTTWNLNTARVYIMSPTGRVGSAELKPAATSSASNKYLVYHYDNLGSVQGLTLWGASSMVCETLFANDESGKESLYSYDAWGERRDAEDWSGASKSQTIDTWGYDNPATTSVNEDDLIPRGYTGHEMLDDVGGYIHMDGRIEKAQFSRFMNADPFVQNPYDLQSYNRYSYCVNNPLRYTDPTGYFVFALSESVLVATYVTLCVVATYSVTPQGQEQLKDVADSATNAVGGAIDALGKDSNTSGVSSGASASLTADPVVTSGQDADAAAPAVVETAVAQVSTTTPDENVVNDNSVQAGDASDAGNISDSEPATSNDVAGEPASTPPEPEDDFDNDQEESQYQNKSRDNESGDYRPKTTGANARDGKMVDDAASQAGVDREALGEAIHQYKSDNRLGASDNIPYKTILKIAESIK